MRTVDSIQGKLKAKGQNCHETAVERLGQIEDRQFLTSNIQFSTLRRVFLVGFVLIASLTLWAAEVPEISIDLSGYSPECSVIVRAETNDLSVAWPLGDGQFGRVLLNLATNGPLLSSVGIASSASAKAEALLTNVDPVTFITVGTRVAPQGRPPSMSYWNVFFDRPGGRPYESYLARLDRKQVRVTSQGRRATIALGNLTAGPFSGELQLTFYSSGPIFQVETVVSTSKTNSAIFYDAGLVGEPSGWKSIRWTDTEGRSRDLKVDSQTPDKAVAVRHRAIAAEAEHGSVVCFPSPHQFQFPRDWTDNLKFTWIGRNHLAKASPFGFGVRQVADGKRAFEPWFNAPPGTRQRLGIFYLVSRAPAEGALREVLRYTHGDRFPKLPGRVTFTSHYHMGVAVDAMARKFQGTPEFVAAFKELGVNAVHIADFHGDGHPKDPGPLRLPELAAMFKECRRLSDAELLLIPGEEINEFLGIAEPGKHPGHWMSLFPKPVYWIEQRRADEPFAETHSEYGTVYRVGNRQDMMSLLEKEQGLAWSAHPRIKASSWTPDIFRREDFYLTNFWLGAAWKAMPADLSRERLGERGLDLLNDMANWGQRKYMPGEVDVFKIDHTHELYGHMNINYVRLKELPSFDQGWQPILDALRRGDFFVTTGEILLREFGVAGKSGGEALTLKPGERPEVRATVQWTFPLRFAEIISGDGQQVYRERIDLADTGQFGQRTLTVRPELSGRRWVRFEIWDVAANGAFTQLVWLEQESK